LSRHPDDAAAALDSVLTSADSALREARNAIWDMRTVELEGRDVAEALERAARTATEGTSVKLAFTVQGSRRRLSESIETTALRIGREAVVNAVKHARATHVEIVLTFAASALELRVCDDGIGIQPDTLAKNTDGKHLGLTGMRSRAERAGGTLEIAKGELGGTVIAAKLPA